MLDQSAGRASAMSIVPKPHADDGIRPTREPLFWAALAFSAGLFIGVRAWRPATWWVIAVVAFVLAALWYRSRRAWAAKLLSLATWFLLGAFLI